MLWRQQQSATPTASREGRSPFLSGVLRAVCHEFALRAVCHAWRAFKPLFLIGSIQTFISLVGSPPLFCAEGAFFTLSATTKINQVGHIIHIIAGTWTKSKTLTESVTTTNSYARSICMTSPHNEITAANEHLVNMKPPPILDE